MRSVFRRNSLLGTMTPRERLLTVTAAGTPDQTPFNIWSNKIPDDTMLQELLAREACITIKSEAYAVSLEGIRVDHVPFRCPDGTDRIRLTYHTPTGMLEVIQRPMQGTVWTEQHPFSGAEDYDSLEYLVASRRYRPCPERLLQDDLRFPGQSIARPATLRSPLHEVINELLGVENFCVEWFENRERVERLCRLVHDDVLERIRLLADAPVPYCIVDGNTQFDVIGLERYEEHTLPYINEACEILHAAGKRAGAHLDGNNSIAAHLIARSGLDFVESFSPEPSTDLALASARAAWPAIGLIVNFPPAVHLLGWSAVRESLRRLRHESGDLRGVALAIIEDIPTSEYIVPLAEEVRSWWTARTIVES